MALLCGQGTGCDYRGVGIVEQGIMSISAAHKLNSGCSRGRVLQLAIKTWWNHGLSRGGVGVFKRECGHDSLRRT